jgi:hypothetical protein
MMMKCIKVEIWSTLSCDKWGFRAYWQKAKRLTHFSTQVMKIIRYLSFFIVAFKKYMVNYLLHFLEAIKLKCNVFGSKH